MPVLRIDPAHPPLWRDERTLQFGADDRARIDRPPPWQLRLIHDLQKGLPRRALAVLAERGGGSVQAVDDLLETLAPVLQPPESPRLRVVLEAAAGDPAAERVCEALDTAGLIVATVDGTDRVPATADRTLPRVLVAHHALPPPRARAALRDDAPHVPIVFSGRSAVVGPLVVAGETACLQCLEAHRRDADAAWPMLLAQLLGRDPVPVPAALATEAGRLAAHLIRGEGPRAPRATDGLRREHSATLTSGAARRQWRSHAPHPECGCRSPRGIATDSVRRAPVRVTRRATVFALPA